MTGFLASIARRAARPGNRLVPKGVLPRVASKPDVEQEEEPVRSLHLAREAQEENEEARPLRRSAEMKPEEEVPPTQRAVLPTKEEEAAQALRRRDAGSPRSEEEEEEEPVHPLRRSVEAGPDEEREAAPMRRATNETEEEEAAQALRRAEAPPQPEETQEPPLSRTRVMRRDDEEAIEDETRALRRMGETPPAPDEMEPAEELRGEEEPSAVTALRRDVAPAPAAVPATEAPMPVFEPAAGAFQEAAFAPPSFERPVVQIDRLDVLIHEPAATPRRAAIGCARSIRARYLRRL